MARLVADTSSSPLAHQSAEDVSLQLRADMKVIVTPAAGPSKILTPTVEPTTIIAPAAGKHPRFSADEGGESTISRPDVSPYEFIWGASTNNSGLSRAKTGKSIQSRHRSRSCAWLSLYMDRYVVLSSNRLRKAWNVLLAVLLAYVATILPYRLCFVELAIPKAMPTSDGWSIIEWFIDGLFWLDLISGFFFSYKDAEGREITDWNMIVNRYLRGYFAMNLIACHPSRLTKYIADTITNKIGEESNVHKGVRLARLQRISRLARLLRLGRMSKLVLFFEDSPVWQSIQTIRGVRVINLSFGLLWIIHLVACGWYLTASFHIDYRETWVARRFVDVDENVSLLSESEGPAMKWAHSMYFVLTVFTSVGFGDMSALTTGEIFYCCCTMLLGAVVQSIIMSEVINVLTSADEIARQVQEQQALVQEFSEHARLTPKIATKLASWANRAHTVTRKFDVDRMKEVLTSSALGRGLTRELPHALYDGLLMRNRFLVILKCMSFLPPRLPLLMALEAKLRNYSEREVVYSCNDVPSNIFLVMSGIFVHVAEPAEFRRSKGSSRSKSALHSHSVLESVFMTPSESPILLTPYQIFSGCNYFGEAEIFLSQSDKRGSRNTVACCESAGDTLLVFEKDLTNLVTEFPHSAEAWYFAAARRENHRKKILLNLQMHDSVEDLAASIIQQHVRQLLQRKERPSMRHDALFISARQYNARQFVHQPTSGSHNKFDEQIPEYAQKLQRNVDNLQRDVSALKTCMETMNGDLLAIAEALQVNEDMNSLI